ncbi:hypothetical protein VJ918_00915 [Adlercreutzia sp. R21]|uniref:hypothetical protein n=1 Tax=Adlercreutzia wanghongyangiae TaxID=3111451 RepID=UPI002DBFEB43|nr:hypothetical protein [Adlercreutzia sp. R21]MEC4183363.1 hypothetical protein [Adlercreutzia sp. R21]
MGLEKDGAAASRPPRLVMLPSKIACPGVAGGTVRRVAVADALEGVAGAALTTVVAPAGFGKTTAVAQWAAETPLAVAWCSLDEDDADPARFWAVVCSAVLSVAGDLGIPDNFLDVPWADQAASHAALAELIVALTAHEGDLAVVLEDIHAVQGSLTSGDSLSYFIRHLPPNIHVVATSRMPLRIPLAKLRMQGKLLEIGESLLRFTADEESELFSSGGAHLDGAALARMRETTGGWPAASRLLAMCCEGAGVAAAEQAIERARENVGEYLLEEVVSSVDADLLDFMVNTSVVDSFDADLAAAITGESADGVRRLIDEMAASGLFVQRLPREGRSDWFRYHAMLLEVLQERFKRLPEPERAAMAQRARDWYLAEGYDDAAVTLSYWMRDWDAICGIIAARWRSRYMNDDNETVLRWAMTLPPDVLEAHPFVCAAAALPTALVKGPLEANGLIHKAMLRLKDGDDFLFAFCMVQKAFLAVFQGQWDACRDFAERALRFLPAEEHYLRGMMLQLTASSLQYVDPVESKRCFAEALEAQRLTGNANLICSALGNLAVLAAVLGQNAEADKFAHQALALYDEGDRERKPMLAHAHWARAVVAHREGDDARFVAELGAYRRLAAASRVPSLAVSMDVIEANRLMALGEGTKARSLLAGAMAEDALAVSTALPSLPLIRLWLAGNRGAGPRDARAPEPRLALLAAALGYCSGDYDVADAVADIVRATPREDVVLCTAARILASLLAFQGGRARAATDLVREAFDIATRAGRRAHDIRHAEGDAARAQWAWAAARGRRPILCARPSTSPPARASSRSFGKMPRS